jgi:hypothetical protein
MTTLAPGVSTVWAIFDVALCHYGALKPFYYLAESTFLTMISLVLGSLNSIRYEEARS